MRKLMVCIAILALAAVGCADEDPTVGDVAGSPEATSEADESPKAEHEDHGTETFTTEEFDVEMELDDFYFEPTTIKAPGGSTATLELHNEGSVPHTFTMDNPELDEELQPGDTREVTVELGTDTKVDFHCRFHREAQGMEGSFSLH